MAGAGYKLFNTGDVLTAAQVNTYLMQQTVMVFASSAARTTALSGVLAEGMVSYLQDSNTLEVYDGSAWVGATGDITGLTAGTGITITNATGPVPTVTNDVVTTIDAKGDLIVGTGDNTYIRQAVGSNNQVLMADSAQSDGVKWANEATATLTAKGDILSASGANTLARLAVGSNGESIVADSSAATGLRWTATPSASNPILNSAMDIWQRGTSVSISASGAGYTADRWYLSASASNNMTISRQATGDTTNLPNIQYCARIQRNSGQTGTGTMNFAQFFETANSIPFAGKTVTYSFYARAGANHSAGALTVYLVGGTGTDQNWFVTGYTGQSLPVNSSATLTTTWQRFTYTGTIASTVTELTALFQFVPSGTAGANDYWEVTGFQIDVGNTALPFRRAQNTLAGELAACQRYYYRNVANGAFTLMTNMGAAETATNCRFIVQHPVTMRVAPTTIEYSTLIVYSPSGGTNSTVSSFSTVYGGAQHSLMTAGVTGLTANASYFLYTNNSTAGYIAFGAEL